MAVLSHTKTMIGLILLTSLGYAVVRYNFFGQVPWQDLPFFILNKAIALTIVILMLLDQIRDKNRNELKHTLWFFLSVLIFLHVLLSLTILGPEYFKKFYLEDRLNLMGSLSLVSGILAFAGFTLSGVLLVLSLNGKPEFLNDSFQTKLKYFNLLFVGLHVFIMGISGWLRPERWPGNLLPISLIAFIVLVFSAAIIISRDKKSPG